MHFQIVSVVSSFKVALASALSGEAGIPDGSLQMDFAGLCQYLKDALDAVNETDAAALDARADESVVLKWARTNAVYDHALLTQLFIAQLLLSCEHGL